MARTAPAKSLKILGRKVRLSGAFGNLESYGRKGMDGDSLGKSNGEEVVCDFFSLRDFWTKPGSAAYDDLVHDFVETYAFYVDSTTARQRRRASTPTARLGRRRNSPVSIRC